MLRLPHLTKAARRVLIGSAFAGAFFFAAPAAGAQEAPHIDPAALVSQVAGDVASDVKDGLAAVGITDPQTTAAVDAAGQASAQIGSQVNAHVQDVAAQVSAAAVQVRDAVPAVAAQASAAQDYAESVSTAGATDANGEPLTNPNPLGLGQLAEATQPDFQPVLVDPNYAWKNDIVSKVAAMKPTAEYVLHRVPGSYFDAPRTPEESNQALNRGHSLYGPGTPLYVNQTEMCTLTVAGYDAQGRKVGLTAGHCGEVGQQVSSADSWQVGPTGTIVSKDSYLDYSVIELNDKAEVTSQYNGVRAWGLGGGIASGQVTCKRGVATGTTCGMVLASGNNAQITQVCAMGGDSGAPLFKDGKVVGAVTSGLGQVPCRTPWQGALHSPTGASNMDAILEDMNSRGGVGAGFRLAA